MSEPRILSTWSFAVRGNVEAWPPLDAGGSSLDAVETVCRVVENDPEVDSVGYGGLPDRAGAVTLDGCVMLSPAACGSVAAIRRHRHPVSIARRVMEGTEHVMLVGEGADAFADDQGFEPAGLVSDGARERWQAWQRAAEAGRPPAGGGAAGRPVDRGRGGRLFDGDAVPPRGHDTVCVLCLDRRAVLAGACSTSGAPYKMPGRVGDSAIFGHALYVDPDHGAAAATGAGELVMGVCSSFLAVEAMRRGADPDAALAEALDRVEAAYHLGAEDQVAMIAMRPDGGWAAAALRPGYKTSVSDAAGHDVRDAAARLGEK